MTSEHHRILRPCRPRTIRKKNESHFIFPSLKIFFVASYFKLLFVWSPVKIWFSCICKGLLNTYWKIEGGGGHKFNYIFTNSCRKSQLINSRFLMWLYLDFPHIVSKWVGERRTVINTSEKKKNFKILLSYKTFAICG